jgi:hypothetical protein
MSFTHADCNEMFVCFGIPDVFGESIFLAYLLNLFMLNKAKTDNLFT